MDFEDSLAQGGILAPTTGDSGREAGVVAEEESELRRRGVAVMV